MKVLGVLGVLGVLLQISGAEQEKTAAGCGNEAGTKSGAMCCCADRKCAKIAEGCASKAPGATVIALIVTTSGGSSPSCGNGEEEADSVSQARETEILLNTKYPNLFMGFLNKTCEKVQSIGPGGSSADRVEEALPGVQQAWSVTLNEPATSSHVLDNLKGWCGIEGNITKAIKYSQNNKLTKVGSGDGCDNGAFKEKQEFTNVTIAENGTITLAVPYQNVQCTLIMPKGADLVPGEVGSTKEAKACTYELKIGASGDATPISDYLCKDDGFKTCTIEGKQGGETRCKTVGTNITITGVGLAKDGKNEIHCTKAGSDGAVTQAQCEINVKGLDVKNGDGNYTCPQASVNNPAGWCTTPKCKLPQGSNTGTLCTVDSSASSTRSINTSRVAGGVSAGGDALTKTDGGKGGGRIVTTTKEGKDEEEHATKTTNGGSTGKADRQANENSDRNTNLHEHNNQEVTDNSTDPRISALQTSNPPEFKLSLFSLLAFF